MAHTTDKLPNITERHFSVTTLSELWSLSDDVIRDWFANVPGVVKFGTTPGRGRRPRMTLRIPESIAMKVYSEKTR